MMHVDFSAHQVSPECAADYRERAKALRDGAGQWSAAMDLSLMLSLGRGDGVEKAAADLVVTPQQARARFFQIQRAMTVREFLPMEAQKILLDELRAQAARVN